MIRRLRIKFILIAMLTFFTVLTLLVGTINVISYASTERRINGMLELLATNRGAFGGGKPEDAPGLCQDGNVHGAQPGLPGAADRGEREEPGRHHYSGVQITPETPYETRYFVIEYDMNGSAVSCNTDHIAAIGADEALAYADEVRQGGDDSGSVGGIYRYTVATHSDGSSTLVFLDCREQLESRRMLLLSSIIVELSCLIAAFVPVFLLSAHAIRPAVESMEKQKRFITDASHEIKTPLAIISANAEVLELTSGSNEWLDSIKNQTTRLTRLVSRLVTLSRLDEDRPQLTVEEFCLSDAIIDAAAPFCTVAEQAGRQLVLDIEPGLRLRGDEGAIRQLVSLTVDNAIKYSEPGSELRLELRRCGRECVLRVSNVCHDIDRASLPHLFDRFYRSDRSRSRTTGGYGIGLSVAKAICEAHGGSISVEVTDDDVITFSAVLVG